MKRAILQELEKKKMNVKMYLLRVKSNAFATGIHLPEVEEMYNDEISRLSVEIKTLRREIFNDK